MLERSRLKGKNAKIEKVGGEEDCVAVSVAKSSKGIYLHKFAETFLGDRHPAINRPEIRVQPTPS